MQATEGLCLLNYLLVLCEQRGVPSSGGRSRRLGTSDRQAGSDQERNKDRASPNSKAMSRTWHFAFLSFLKSRRAIDGVRLPGISIRVTWDVPISASTPWSNYF